MKTIRQLFAIVISTIIATWLMACATPEKTEIDWKAESNQVAKEYTFAFSEIIPELGSSFGYTQFDDQGLSINNDINKELVALWKSWSERLERKVAEAKHPDLKMDLKILKESVDQSLTELRLIEKYKVVDVAKATQEVFGYLFLLTNDQAPDARKRDAVDRFLIYVNGEGENKPLLLALRDWVDYQKKQYGSKAIYPYRPSLEKYLKDSPAYVQGIQGLLAKSGREDWQEAFAKFKEQVQSYDQYLKDEVLPLARKAPQLPKEVYVHRLKMRGIDKSPDWLIEKGRKDFEKLYKEFVALSGKVAKKRGWKSSAPADVIKKLKAHQVTDPKEVELLYKKADQRLATIIRQHQLVSLPEAPLKIRLAGAAESKANPVPHLTQPPLVNNQGERPEFVVPTAEDGQLPFDDFSYQAAAIVLTAHEGRPGHDLQFSRALDQEVSLIRARYAMNNVNVEGWALQAEDLVYPYLPEESQLVALQTRLWRVARMFLDPEVQLQKAGAEEVVEVFTKKLGVSKTMAQLEYNRYAFRQIGQAPSYYYGLLKIEDLRSRAKAELGDRFHIKCFNDALLTYGVVPVDKIGDRLIAGWQCDM